MLLGLRESWCRRGQAVAWKERVESIIHHVPEPGHLRRDKVTRGDQPLPTPFLLSLVNLKPSSHGVGMSGVWGSAVRHQRGRRQAETGWDGVARGGSARKATKANVL